MALRVIKVAGLTPSFLSSRSLLTWILQTEMGSPLRYPGCPPGSQGDTCGLWTLWGHPDVFLGRQQQWPAVPQEDVQLLHHARGACQRQPYPQETAVFTTLSRWLWMSADRRTDVRSTANTWLTFRGPAAGSAATSAVRVQAAQAAGRWWVGGAAVQDCHWAGEMSKGDFKTLTLSLFADSVRACMSCVSTWWWSRCVNSSRRSWRRRSVTTRHCVCYPKYEEEF